MSAEQPLAGRRILVADDSAPMRIFTRKVLELAGAEVIEAEDGVHALAQAKAHQFDLRLVDMEMPGLDGCEVVRRLRAEGDAIVTLAITAHAGAEEHAACKRAGFDACLVKPYSRAQLVELVAEKLR